MVSSRQARTADILPEAGEIVILNFDILPDDLTPVAAGKDTKGREVKSAALPQEVVLALQSITLIVDEAHRVKNAKAARTAKFRELARLCGRRWGLTGTPLANRPMDLWGVLASLGIARATFGAFERFATMFGGRQERVSRTQTAWVWDEDFVPGVEAAERLRRYVLRREKQDVLDLPPKTYRQIGIEGLLKAAVVKELDRMSAAYADLLDDEELPPFEAMSKIRAVLAEACTPAMVDAIEDFESAGQALVVFSAHRAPIDHLASREGWAVITGDTSAADRADLVRRFQAGELKGIGLTIKAGCEGLTLTRASHMLSGRMTLNLHQRLNEGLSFHGSFHRSLRRNLGGRLWGDLYDSLYLSFRNSLARSLHDSLCLDDLLDDLLDDHITLWERTS